MSHPPIPPKDKLTVCLKNGDLADYCFVVGRNTIAVYDPSDAWRPVLAAYYEVEWRRRAERWARLWAREYEKADDWEGEDDERMTVFSRSETQCLLNANRWRTWGEGE